MKTQRYTKAQWNQIMDERKAVIIKELNQDKNIFNDILPFLFQMRKYERQLQRLAELSCNGYPKPKVEYRDGKMFVFDVEDETLRAKCEKREAKIEAQVRELAKQFNLVPDFQGDPRGLMFTLVAGTVKIEVA